MLIFIRTFTDKGIVIKVQAAGESNKRVVLLLKEYGKVVVSAKGAQNAKSKLSAVTQPFAYCEFDVYRGAGFLSLNKGALIEGFYNVRTDLERFCAACYMLELADVMILPEMPAEAALRLLLKSLKVLAGGKINPRLAMAVFELKMLQNEGFISSEIAPQFLNAECGPGNVELSADCAKAINYILNSEIKYLFSFGISDMIRTELCAFANRLRLEHVDVEFKSLDIIRG